MLQKMREQSQSTATKILLGILIIVFTMFGFGAFEAFMKTDPPAAKVDGVDISQSRLAMETDRQRQRILAQMGEHADPDLIDATRLRGSVLDGLINQTILMEYANDAGLRVSPAEVDRVIVGNPQFQVAGKFDADLYRRLLANAGHTPPTFRAELTNNYALAQLTDAVRETPFVTDDEVRDAARLLAQKRDVAYLMFTPKRFEKDVKIGDDDVKAYYRAHMPDFMTEDTVDVDYVKLSAGELAKSDEFAPTDAQIQAQYDADVKAFKPQERRHVEHILLQVNASRTAAAAKAELAAIKQRLAHGERFEDIARKVSEDPGSAQNGGDLGFISKDAFAPEFDKVAWSLDVNAVSDPVRTQFGEHLIKVLAIKDDQYPKLDEVRPKIVERLREDAAEEKYRAKVRDLDELAFESPDALTQISKTAELPIRHATGVTTNAGPAPFDAPELRKAAFGDDVIAKGFNSRVIEVDKNAYVLRVEGHRPPEQRSLADVTDVIRKKLVHEAAVDRAREAAAEAVARVAKGEAAAAIAAAYGIDWHVAGSIARGAPGVDPEIVSSAFQLPRPTGNARSVTSTGLGSGDVAVVTVSSVKDGDYGALTDVERASIRAELAKRVGNEEFTGLFLTLRDAAAIDRG